MKTVSFAPWLLLKDFRPRFARVFQVKPNLTWQLPLKHDRALSQQAFPPVKGVLVDQKKPHQVYQMLCSAGILLDGNSSSEEEFSSFSLKLDLLRNCLANIENRKVLFKAGLRLRRGEVYAPENVFSALVGRLAQPEVCLEPKYGRVQGSVVQVLNAMQDGRSLFSTCGIENRRRTLANLSLLIPRLADAQLRLDLSGLPLVSADIPFHGIYLRGANLSGTLLAGEFSRADLSETDMRFAILGTISPDMPLILEGASLVGADMGGALEVNLCGAPIGLKTTAFL